MKLLEEIDVKLHSEKITEGIALTLSVSKVKTFDESSSGCKKKYKLMYIDKLPKIDRDFHIFGKFLHAVFENFHRILMDDPEKKNTWMQVLSNAWSMALKGTDKEKGYENVLTTDQITEAIHIVDKYKNILKEEGIPNVIGVENDFYIQLNNRFLLNGFIDRIQIDKDGLIHVADYKTTKDSKYLKDFFQLKTYCYALMLKDESIKRIRASFILLRHDFDYITEEYTREEIMNYVPSVFVKYAESIEEEKIFRANPQFLCKFCDFTENCKEGKDFLIKKGVIEKQPVVGLKKWGR